MAFIDNERWTKEMPARMEQACTVISEALAEESITHPKLVRALIFVRDGLERLAQEARSTPDDPAAWALRASRILILASNTLAACFDIGEDEANWTITDLAFLADELEILAHEIVANYGPGPLGLSSEVLQ